MAGWNNDCVLKHFKRTNMYKNSTGSCTFDPIKIEAWSYKWWLFVTVVNGKVIFNDYNYSSQTNSQQNEVKRVMKELKIKIDRMVYAKCGLQDDWKRELYVDQYETLFLAEYKLNKKGMSQKVKDNCKWEMKHAKKSIKKLRWFRCPLNKKELEVLKATVIARYEGNLESRRELIKERYELKKQLISSVKNEYNDTSALKNYDEYDKLNDMKGI